LPEGEAVDVFLVVERPAGSPPRSAIDVIKSLQGYRSFQSAEEVDRYLEEERNAELAGLRGQVGAIAVALAQRLIGETLDGKRQQALIQDFFAQVPKEAKSLATSVRWSAPCHWTSRAGQDRRKPALRAFHCSVDPRILGGLIVALATGWSMAACGTV
jgi:hypothetical protein